MILQSQDDWDFDDLNHADFAELTTPLVASQRDYTLPANEKVLKIKRVDICYGGTGGTCYRAEPIDAGEFDYGIGNDTNLDAQFSKDSPRFDIKKNSIWIYPRATAADVTAGGIIRAEWTREIVEFEAADTSQEPGFVEPFHRMLSIGAAYDYAVANALHNKDDLLRLLADYEARIKQYYGSKNEARNYTVTPMYVNYN